ncbi:MAG: type II secretion system protein [Candidatus Neomarinimicrobiota bacterium]
MQFKNKKGFTLIELLIVIGIVTILAGIILVAVNPAVQFGKANDSERKSEINSILKGVYQYQASPSSRGNLPECLLGAVPAATTIPECDTDSSGVGVGNGAFEGAVELGSPADADTYDCNSVLTPFYITVIPVDPDNNYDVSATGYYICQDNSGTDAQVVVISVGAEVYTGDGGCEVPGTINETMCVRS